MRELSEATLDVLDRALHEYALQNGGYGTAPSEIRTALDEFREWRAARHGLTHEDVERLRALAYEFVTVQRDSLAEMLTGKAITHRCTRCGELVGPDDGGLLCGLCERIRAAGDCHEWDEVQRLEKATEPGESDDFDPPPFNDRVVRLLAGAKANDCPACKGTGKRKGGEHG